MTHWILAALFAYLALCVARFVWRAFRTQTKRKSKGGIAGYSLFYTDQVGMLSSARLGLRGKPDAIYKKNNGNALVPFEIKSGTIGTDTHPRQGDLMQLAAYFALIEDWYGVRPKYGKLVYSDFMFTIKNTPTLRAQLQDVMDAMDTMLQTGEENVCPSFATCRHCICRGTVCEWAE